MHHQISKAVPNYQIRAATDEQETIMKTIALAAAFAALIAAAPVQAASFGQLPQTFNDQGSQAPAFPGTR